MGLGPLRTKLPRRPSGSSPVTGQELDVELVGDRRQVAPQVRLVRASS